MRLYDAENALLGDAAEEIGLVDGYSPTTHGMDNPFMRRSIAGRHDGYSDLGAIGTLRFLFMLLFQHLDMCQLTQEHRQQTRLRRHLGMGSFILMERLKSLLLIDGFRFVGDQH